jgi:transglutaminase-like putative cysteine protease
MLVLLLALKLLEMRAKRDLFVVLFLSFFLMLTNFFYSQGIVTALMMVAAIIALLTAQLSFQYTGVVPPFKKRLRLGALIFALAVPPMLMLFLLFPRIQGPLWGLPGDAHAGRSGLSDSMAPGNISSLALSDDIAFRIKFIDPAPPQAALYWRGVVLGNYDGRTWSALQPRVRHAQTVTLSPHGAPVRYQVTLEPHGRRWLFALEVPQAIPQLAGNPAGITGDLQLLATQPINQRVRYDATSYVGGKLQATESALTLQDWLQLPPGFNPQTLAWAAQLRHQSDDDAVLVNSVLQFFRKQPFSYTLEPPLLGKHAVDDFLFSTRAGFCEHYASAFVVLMRALDIPARVVTGYQGGEINPVDGFMSVRQSDAHAWAEVWLKGSGWTRIDPTAAVAPNRIEMNLSRSVQRRGLSGLFAAGMDKTAWLDTLRINWDAMTNSWNQWVLNYNMEQQKNFLAWLGFDDVDWRTLASLMLGIGVLLTALMTVPLLWGQRPKIEPVDALYLALCQNMAQRGHPRAIHEGPHAYGARLAAELAADRYVPVARFLALYEQARYGKNDAKSRSAMVSELKSQLAQCR